MKTYKKIPTKLPKRFYRYFWDVEAKEVNPAKHPKYVINRLLDKGDLSAARWVLAAFPKEKIVETLKTMLDFSPWNGVFWTRFLGIPPEETRCLNPHYLRLRKKLWPY